MCTAVGDAEIRQTKDVRELMDKRTYSVALTCALQFRHRRKISNSLAIQHHIIVDFIGLFEVRRVSPDGIVVRDTVHLTLTGIDDDYCIQLAIPVLVI